ncbi:copper resistance protein NlpE N-terminal domain-containing protein [Flavobacterium piscinae]|uniref:copper resistance protein NlpE N-terminal domain-containing protein n=2 Tax=Flavobacterium piscinae TaxID=2506424 RepID=UPI001C9E42BC|nr:copper resistance protein NlpE N-terminal domain-containing protein [Flavobacterium piscinae]
MRTKIATLLFLYLLIMSCAKKVKEEATDVITVDSTEILMNKEHNAKISLDYSGMYQGVLPCADCEGIETTLWIDENNYVLFTNYLGKKNKTKSEFRGSYVWNEFGNTIILKGIENAPNHYFVGENYLKQLDMDGNKIEGDLAEKYVLQKKSDSGELPPPPPPAPETIKNYSIHSKSLENISLVKNKWRLIELNGKPIESKEMFIKLNSEEGYVAFAGCNNMMGSVEFKDEKSLIKFTKGASTLMACPDMTTEQEFAEMLEKVDNYSINGNNLSFNRGRMAPLARFEAMK